MTVADTYMFAAPQVNVTWAVLKAPPGYVPGMVVITPHSISAASAWASFAGAPPGQYVLAITASDGLLASSETVMVTHQAWPRAMSFVAPQDDPFPGKHPEP